MEKIKVLLQTYWQWLLGGVIIIVVLIWRFWPAPQANNQIVQSAPQKQQTKIAHQTSTSRTIMVDVQGEVNKPGVYHLLTTARVYDALQHAGGPTANANLQGINQAQKLHDQGQVIVPNKNQSTSAVGGDTTASMGANSKSINLNSATSEELQQVNGLGPKKADAIVQYRQDHGTFSSVNDLTKVKGIGDKTVESLKDQLSV
ncbi:ComEA family DNA-binding protein [Bombilactobacillus folatiphilus]|uniref:ComEA family DNA-binding protein n=1 Tax=Bombilactobacillus folatiphilus TaxID=2923362 RepID=A0ABY4PB33_9LACO|nr:ComEA family DNA-binding protein [Bombilactobacillus folatiphilus]UQS82741.1 ComEA family DNA-binding protein [Bombilactobacillus folatiphilus]